MATHEHVRDAILNQPGLLDADEFRIIQTDPVVGAELLRAWGLGGHGRFMLEHHERIHARGGLMDVSPRIYLPLLGLLVLASLLTAGRSLSAARSGPQLSEVAGARYRLDPASAKSSGARLLPQDVRRDGFHFAPTVAPSDRQAFLDAVAAARPEALRLIGLVDGLVDVRIGPTGTPGAIGLTEDGEPGYRVTIDLDLVLARYGPRGVQRTVLHELGHVVDHALLTDDVTTALDAGIPAGLGCEEGKLGGCASREERFAESFAKWALDDIGVNLDIGYKVPPPSPPLDIWGAPLARLAAAG